jgi:aminomethyltransferase
MPPFDMNLVQRGARNRRTPYYEATQKYSPKAFTVYNHMYFPIRFDTFENEFQALLNDVTIWDVSVERCIEVSGPDGFKFAQLLTPRNLSKCAVGQGKYVLVCDSDGGIINDPVMTRMDENTFWFALASSDVLLFAKGLKNAYPKLNVTLRERDTAPLQVQGPKSKNLMSDLVGKDILDMKYYWWRKAEIRGVPVVITRTGWTSEVGYEIYLLDPTKGTVIWEALMEVGKPYNVNGVTYTPTEDARYRAEGVASWYGPDFHGRQTANGEIYDMHSVSAAHPTMPLPSYARVSNLDNGRSIVVRVNDRGPFPATVMKPIGRQAGASRSEGDLRDLLAAAQENIGYCWATEMAKDGTKVKVDSEWGPRTGTVVPIPFVDPDKRIPVS